MDYDAKGLVFGGAKGANGKLGDISCWPHFNQGDKRLGNPVAVWKEIDAAESVGQFMAGRRRVDPERDRMLLFAVLRAIEVIGEAASRVSDETRAANPAIPWSVIAGMRNRLVHGYFDIDAEIPSGAPDHVVRTVTENSRTLKFTSQGFEKE